MSYSAAITRWLIWRKRSPCRIQAQSLADKRADLCYTAHNAVGKDCSLCSPQDPYILLSVINTKLRDEYSSLSALCEGLDADEKELVETLSGAGYAYDPDANQFKPI